MKRGDPGPHLAILQKMAGSDIYLRGKTEARESKERGGSRSRGDPRERGGKRVHESTARAPPKYAFRPKDPHFEIDPHDFPGIYIYTRSTSAISTRSASFHLGSTLASSIVLIELGRHRNATREFLESGSRSRGENTRRTPTTRRKISIPSLPCFSPPSVSFYRPAIVFLFLFPTFRLSRFHSYVL